MTAPPAPERTASRLGVVAGTLGVIAGIMQATAGSRIPDWTGNKDNPLGLGLLTILLNLVSLGAAASVRGSAETSTGQRVAVALVLLVPGMICFSTVGRL